MSGSESIEMIWTRANNGWVPYGQRGVVAEVSTGQVRGRPRLGWMDGAKVTLGNRGMTVEAARQCAKDRKKWRALVHL